MDRAYNEDVDVDGYSSGLYFGYGSAQSEGFGYRLYVGEYMSDNNTGAENTITFEYAYETSDGEIVAGEMTLPVQ